MKKMSEKGVSLIEALVATVIIGIGFVAVFQMVQYSIRSIDVSGERTKATYLSSMIAEDIYSDKNQEKDSKTFIDKIYDSPWELAKCKNIGDGISFFDANADNAYDNKTKKWNSRFSKDYFKCKPNATGETVDRKNFKIFKVCDTGCDVKLKKAFDTIYIGRIEVNMNASSKKKILYFQIK
tara:strand:+ start:340 stop:882 length:543 start_codon:yes stop_codon:yes gene_type:complete